MSDPAVEVGLAVILTLQPMVTHLKLSAFTSGSRMTLNPVFSDSDREPILQITASQLIPSASVLPLVFQEQQRDSLSVIGLSCFHSLPQA
jgi:hypothetical protein